MKYVVAGLSALALALAPNALAQAPVACSDIEEVISYAMDDFQDITGEEVEEGSGVYAVSYELPTANACTARFDVDSYYLCLWSYNDEASARSAYRSLTRTVTDCVADWKSTPVIEGEDPILPDGVMSYVVRSGVGDYEDMEIVVHVDRFEDPDNSAVSWEVWYELTYYLT